MSALDIDTFLQNNSELHSDMNAILGLNGIDLLDVNLSDDRQKTAWMQYHFLEHQNAEAKLGIGS